MKKNKLLFLRVNLHIKKNFIFNHKISIKKNIKKPKKKKKIKKK